MPIDEGDAAILGCHRQSPRGTAGWGSLTRLTARPLRRCQNGTGRYIHPGAASNVYEQVCHRSRAWPYRLQGRAEGGPRRGSVAQFVVETNPLLGSYHNCNPNPFGAPGAGVFNCDSMDYGDGHCVCPGDGNSRVEFQLWDEDCFNGTGAPAHLCAPVHLCACALVRLVRLPTCAQCTGAFMATARSARPAAGRTTSAWHYSAS